MSIKILERNCSCTSTVFSQSNPPEHTQKYSENIQNNWPLFGLRKTFDLLTFSYILSFAFAKREVNTMMLVQ